MIECIFTLDYEIYGNGVGALRELVLEPTRRLSELFQEFDAPFVVFTEAVEFAKMEQAQSDPDTGAVRAQLRELRSMGHEIALHLHPWWANATYQSGRWNFDWSERNICLLHPQRIVAIVSAAIQYLREALDDPEFSPLSFRSGLWAMQPTTAIANVLTAHGIEVDSSVFKGGRVRGMGLDYRQALRNGSSWRFRDEINKPDPNGVLLEIPICTQMVPFWRMLGGKRLQLHSKTRNASEGSPLPRTWCDFVRFRYPRKLDFCRMTFPEMREVVSELLKEGAKEDGRRPIVAIGHSKDFEDVNSVREFLAFLRNQDIAVTTFSRKLCPEPQLSL